MFAKTLTALATAIVLGAAFASPAMSAGSKDRHMAAPEQAFAQFNRTGGRWHSSNPAYDVYANGMWPLPLPACSRTRVYPSSAV